MSEENKVPLTDEQRRAIVAHMFKKTHEDLGLSISLLTKNPTTDGFFVQTELAGEMIVRMTRAMGALEKLIQLNSPKAEENKPATDGFVGGTWGVTPAPPDDGKPVYTEAARALLNDAGETVIEQMHRMTVGLIKPAATTAEKPAAGTEAL